MFKNSEKHKNKLVYKHRKPKKKNEEEKSKKTLRLEFL
jgi:hypothetical protein